MSRRTHTLDILEPFADAIFDGRKTFEVRGTKHGIQVGDHVTFRVVRKGALFSWPVEHPLNGLRYEVAYILSGWGVEPDHIAFSIRRVESRRDQMEKGAAHA